MEKLRTNLHWYILGLLAAATLLIWYAVAAEDRAGKLTVAFLDVGQGDAIFINTNKSMIRICEYLRMETPCAPAQGYSVRPAGFNALRCRS